MEGIGREIDSFFDKDVIEILNKSEKETIIKAGTAVYIPGRFVLTEKIIEKDGIKTEGIKARRVLRGDKDKRKVEVNLPTPPQSSVRAFLYMAQQYPEKYTVLADFKTAFLNSRIQPDDLQVITDAIDKNGKIIPNQFWKLKSCVYGLKDAPRKWWITLTTRLIALGYK